MVAHRLHRLAPRSGPPAAGAEQNGSAPLDLIPFEWEVLAAVDGERDLHALAEVLGRSEFEVARTVYGLTAAGVVVLGDPARAGQEPEPGRDLAALLVPAREALAQGEYEIAEGALEELLRRDPLMPEARRLLGVCQAAHGAVLAGAGDLARLGPARPAHVRQRKPRSPAVERHAARGRNHG